MRFAYAPGLVARVKGIPGRQWVGRERCWTLPARTDVVAVLVSRLRCEGLCGDSRPCRGVEIRARLEAVENSKHRVILMLVYAGGLRVSEVV